MEDRHVQLALRWMMVCVVDFVSEYLVVEGIVQCREELTIEAVQNLVLNVGGVNVLECSI